MKEPVLSKGNKALCEGKSNPIFLDEAKNKFFDQLESSVKEAACFGNNFS